MEQKNKLISLGQLASDKTLGLSKSKLSYYASLGLISPVQVVGKMQIYDEIYLRNRLVEIDKYKKEGKTLEEIQEIFKRF